MKCYNIITSLLLAITLHEVSGSENKRSPLPDPASLLSAIQQVDLKIDQLKATHAQDIAQLTAAHVKEVADLRAELNTEKLERCRTGVLYFHREECAANSCTESQVIHFSPPFTKPPVVTHAFSAIDADNGRHIRISSSVSAISSASAILTVITWADSIVYQSDVNWIACPNM